MNNNLRTALAILLGLAFPLVTSAQTQTFPCETVTQFGTGTSSSGAKLRPGGIDPFFDGISANFPNTPNAYVVTNPPTAWIANASSSDSQWIGPSVGTADDLSGTYLYRLRFTNSCAGGVAVGRWAAGDRGALRLNGAPVSFQTPAVGYTNWTAFTFNNLPAGANTLDFYVTNTAGLAGAGPTGLRAELTVTATCCPCIVLNCPSDIFVTTCTNGAPVNFSITGTNRCYTNLTISCALNLAGANIPVVSGSVFPVGTNNVLCTATDTVGHRTNCTFRVVVRRDSQPPSIRCPDDIVYLCGATGTNVFFNVPAVDDTDPAPVVACTPPSGSFFPAGTNRVTCEARDACGRTSKCDFNILVVPGGFTMTLQGGFADNLAPGLFEPATPGPCLPGTGHWSGMPFDTSWPGRYLSHSFVGLPNNITGAKLTLRMKPTLPASLNDILGVGLVSCTPPTGWIYAQPVSLLPDAGGTWQTNAPTTFTLDFATLPGSSNLFAALNADHRLDFAVGTETMVDFARLELTYCGPQSTVSGVPYSMQNVYPIHQGAGVSWRTVNSNDPPILDLDLSRADGLRLEFDDGSIIPCIRVQLPGAITPAVATILDEPTPGLTRLSLSQPGNTRGKSIEVWSNGQLVSRQFFAGPDDIAALVPANAEVDWIGIVPCFFVAKLAQPTAINIPGGQPAVGDMLRLSYLDDPTTPEARTLSLTLLRHELDVTGVSLLRNDTWMRGHGNQQLTISDVIYSKPLHDWFDSLFGNCIDALPGWSSELQNPVLDFCTFDGISETCSGGYVDVNIKAGVNFGGVRLTPTLLPLDSCRIDNTVANSTANNVVITRTVGLPVTVNNLATVTASHWPVKVSGNAGPQSFTLDLPTNTTVTANGVTYNATRVTMNANPLVLAEFYQACVETVTAPQIAMYSMTAPPVGAVPLPCLTLTCSTNIIANCTGAGGTVVTFNSSGATRCGGNVVVTCVPPSGSAFPPGVTVVDCSAIDSQGNQDRCRFLVTVRDTSDPVLAVPPRIIVPCTSPRGAVVDFVASATDGCDAAPVVICSPPSGSVFPVGTNYVTCRAQDSGGNSASQEFPVIVSGGCGTSPCLEVTVPADMFVRCTGVGGARAFFTATGLDRCTGAALTPVCVPPSGSAFSFGETRVVCTVNVGTNTTSASFHVEVTDDTAPTLNCPSNLVVAAQSERGAVVTFAVTGQDDCASNVRVRCSPPSGGVFPVGTNTVTCEGTDGHGNVASCTFNVIVGPAEPLRVTRVGSRLELRWTGDAVPEFTDVLSDETIWRRLNGVPTSNGVERLLLVVPTESMRYFRLQLLDLLPLTDADGDGVPDAIDRCPNTPAGLPVDVNGCSSFDLLSAPEQVFDPEREMGSAALRLLELDGFFPGVVRGLTPLLANSNNPSIPLRGRLLSGALHSQSNLVSGLRVAVADFLAQMPARILAIQRLSPALDDAHADARPGDFELLRLEEIETGLLETLTQSTRTLQNLSNVVRAAGIRLPREQVAIQSLDLSRGSARLPGGRLVLLPGATSPGAPPLAQIPGVFSDASLVNMELSQLPDGSFFGHAADPVLTVNPNLVHKLDPRCLRIRIEPAHPGLPGWDPGVRHHLKGYKWGYTADSGYHFLEYGMAFAVVPIQCSETPGTFKHYVKVSHDDNKNGNYTTLAGFMAEGSPLYLIRPNDLPSGIIFPIRFSEFRAPILPDGSTGTPELLGEETHLVEIQENGFYAAANYDRTIFEIEDHPLETGFQKAKVTSLTSRHPLTIQTPGQQTFNAVSYEASGNSSSYPNMGTIHLNETFAVHVKDPNDQLFFAHTNDLKRGLYAPSVRGFNHGKPFQYRVTLPKLVRDRLHVCTGTDSYYRIPFLFVAGWHVSQGNNGEFTHNGNQKYAFDFPKPQGTLVLAARGGIVLDIQESGSASCWDPDAINSDGEEGDCVNCTGMSAGNFVKILHQDGTRGVYVHFRNNGVLVNKGQRVYRGSPIGQVGTTGCSTGPHLHFHVTEHQDTGVTIPIKFETYDDEGDFRPCYVPPHDSVGRSTNLPVF